jgi:murein L,D-transpeptidase YafK
MGKVLIVAVLAAAAVLLWPGLPHLRARMPDDSKKLSGPERVRRARAESGMLIAQKFKTAGLPYPAREIFLRWFKREAVVELWGREDRGQFRLVASYEILATSGGPGPKRRQGDRQVPEGFYEIDRFNPESLFHLSLGLNYPNASDRILSDRDRPGGDIFIHGKDVSIGCAPLGDAAIEQLYLATLDTRNRGQARIPVHIFPARMRGAEWTAYAAEQTARNPALARFWEQLQPAFDAFESDRKVPAFTVAPDGSYRFAPAR